MAHAQKPHFVFRRKGRVHLNRRGRQFSRLLAAEVCGSAVVMLDTPCYEVVWRVLATYYIRQFPLHFPSLSHHVPSHFNWTLLGVSPGGTVSQCVGLTTLPPSCAGCLETLGASISWIPKGLSRCRLGITEDSHENFTMRLMVWSRGMIFMPNFKKIHWFIHELL
jgi:hypothetical protein